MTNNKVNNLKNSLSSINCNEEWEKYCEDESIEMDNNYNMNNIDYLNNDKNINLKNNENIPKCSEIYISTKTKISFLDKAIDLKETFWKIPVIDYSHAQEGVIKK